MLVVVASTASGGSLSNLGTFHNARVTASPIRLYHGTRTGIRFCGPKRSCVDRGISLRFGGRKRSYVDRGIALRVGALRDSALVWVLRSALVGILLLDKTTLLCHVLHSFLRHQATNNGNNIWLHKHPLPPSINFGTPV